MKEFSLDLAVTVLKIITIFLHSFLSYHEFSVLATLENEFHSEVDQRRQAKYNESHSEKLMLIRR